jgi:hypothetical protein
MFSSAIVSDPYQNTESLEFRIRQKRYRQVRILIDKIVSKLGHCRILDIGGTEAYWSIASAHIDNPRIQVDLLNLEPQRTTKPNFRCIVGNACDLSELDDMSYDFVHSNSVVEHVGTWCNMLRFAQNVRRLAPTYFVQTPYFWFPIEPHFRVPIFHWLPEALRYRLILARPLGFMRKASSVSDAVQLVQSAVLLDCRQFAVLFPDAEIKHERFFGLTKSLMAARADCSRQSPQLRTGVQVKDSPRI